MSQKSPMQPAQFSFTKALVHDLALMNTFYQTVFGWRQVASVQDRIGGEPIDEIILSPTGNMSMPSLILLKFVERPAPAASDSILGFTVENIQAVFAALSAAGAVVVDAPREMPHLALIVGFARDPEGRLLEIVQMLA